MKKRMNGLLVLCAVLLLTAHTVQAQTEREARLDEKIQQATAYLDTCQQAQYPYGLLENLRDAIVYARNMRAGEMKSSELSSQTSKLNTMLNNLKRSFGKAPFAPVESLPTYDAHRGFRHPGGLHTAEDFERIKAQLRSGNTLVTRAYEVLKTAAYAQPSAYVGPVETVVRGGGVGENYMSAARASTMAYQNGLRWQIEGNEACAKQAVKILNDWANVTKGIGGDSNYALAAGLYGYAFAQAAELVRDYEGWAPEDFQKVCQWMVEVWYRSAMGFLRGRNGTWENAGRWWQAPGHYWSNWGLCNALCVMSIGVLCDDVFIYNQGLSFIKHDQCGTFTDPRTANPIVNDGLTEFFGNLIVTTTESELETGAYGRLGQMNESGRDGGHAAMALGLAVDVAHLAYNQGDDLFAFMDHRLAAGIEYTAACTQSVENLPWTDYLYVSSGYAASDSRAWKMTEPALPAHTRNYWGTVIGHYEGVKGVRMPFSEKTYEMMGIDGGGAGATSGGYDHLGYSVLMNTREPQLAPAEMVPTELSGQIVFNGQTLKYNELGGLTNTFTRNNAVAAVEPGQTAQLVPVLPEGETDTGNWLWDTGETTKTLDVTTDCSRMYRVTYTNARGIKSQQCFTIATQGDCRALNVETAILRGDEVVGTDEATVDYGDVLTLRSTAYGGVDAWCSCTWDTGETTGDITTGPMVRDRDFYVCLMNQGGACTVKRIRIHVDTFRLETTVNGTAHRDTTQMIVDAGDKVVIGLNVHKDYRRLKCEWDSGETTSALQFNSIDASQFHTLRFSEDDGEEQTAVFQIFVRDANGDADLTPGNYLIRHAATGLVLTYDAEGECVLFDEPQGDVLPVEQRWYASKRGEKLEYNLQTLADSMYLSSAVRPTTSGNLYPYRFEHALGCQRYAIRLRSGRYLSLADDHSVDNRAKTVLDDYPFELIPVEDLPTGIGRTEAEWGRGTDAVFYDLGGRRLDMPRRGLNIVRRTLPDGRVLTEKVLLH